MRYLRWVVCVSMMLAGCTQTPSTRVAGAGGEPQPAERPLLPDWSSLDRQIRPTSADLAKLLPAVAEKLNVTIVPVLAERALSDCDEVTVYIKVFVRAGYDKETGRLALTHDLTDSIGGVKILCVGASDEKVVCVSNVVPPTMSYLNALTGIFPGAYYYEVWSEDDPEAFSAVKEQLNSIASIKNTGFTAGCEMSSDGSEVEILHVMRKGQAHTKVVINMLTDDPTSRDILKLHTAFKLSWAAAVPNAPPEPSE